MIQGIEKLSTEVSQWNNNTVEIHQWWNVASLNKVKKRSSLDNSINLIGAF